MFSVVIPLYNKENSIKDTVWSVLCQTFEEFEIIVVNDGSSDNSVHAVKQIHDCRIKIIEKQNGGVSSARNRGIREAKYDWVSFLDGDDRWHPEYLTSIHDMIGAHDSIRFFATGFAKATKTLEVIEEVYEQDMRIVKDYFEEVLKKNNTVLHTSAVTINKGLFDLVGYFNESLTHGEDLDMWERLSRKSDIAIAPKVRSYYIQDSENRAVNKMPPINKTRVYNIDPTQIQSDIEKRYFTKAVVTTVLKSLKAKRIRRAIELANRHIRWVGPLEYIKVLIIKILSR